MAGLWITGGYKKWGDNPLISFMKKRVQRELQT